MNARRLRLGLRARTTIGFALASMLIAAGFAVVTYAVGRSYLLGQRENSAVRQAYVNARLARTLLRDPAADVPSFLSGLGGGTASVSALRHRGEWFSTSVAFGSATLPPALVSVVTAGHAGHQRFRGNGRQLSLAVGVPIATAEAAYFEIFPLDEVERTLMLLAGALGIGVVSAAAVAAAIGRSAARRLVRPLAPVADAAERIAGGALDTRLEKIGDPDLRRLSDAFNLMASSLEERIDRETRFAADVSHELRSPIAAVAAAVDIIDRRRDDLPPQVIEAFTVLAAKVALFQRTVLDLLEISRLDAGTAVMSVEPIETADFLDTLLASHGADGAVLDVDPEAPARFFGDRRRLAQAMGNIVDNARNYAGGVTRVSASLSDANTMRLTFEDRGPGIAKDEREAIFGRFARVGRDRCGSRERKRPRPRARCRTSSSASRDRVGRGQPRRRGPFCDRNAGGRCEVTTSVKWHRGC